MFVVPLDEDKGFKIYLAESRAPLKTELPLASVLKRVYVQNHGNGNDFDLHEN